REEGARGQGARGGARRPPRPRWHLPSLPGPPRRGRGRSGAGRGRGRPRQARPAPALRRRGRARVRSPVELDQVLLDPTRVGGVGLEGEVLPEGFLGFFRLLALVIEEAHLPEGI